MTGIALNSKRKRPLLPTAYKTERPLVSLEMGCSKKDPWIKASDTTDSAFVYQPSLLNAKGKWAKRQTARLMLWLHGELRV
eukprot:CAMPEP_0171495252 /NCGR_PEP_ID=MMETSP0958-20121227/6038_1 /TAXON_ID=87120 /ORGANISM="Aurantiochytrium limacinum, Strain ATCCMYA-1381" /LENGTH=80 /DNA_ID=CAMNT_0012029213 /DNA_START=367 /DNA_END=609 /DNA_ORIENTATION=+